MLIFQIINKLWRFAKTGPLTILVWAAGLNIVFGVAFYFVERDAQEGLTFLDSLWWSMVTMTTVGYGDFYAKTFVGRFLISYPCMILGIGIIGYLVGAIANTMIDWASKKRKGGMKVRFKNHVIICNFPGSDKVLTIIRELRACKRYAKARFVIVSETLDEIPQSLIEEKVAFVKGFPTDEETLFNANILECSGVVVLAEDPSDPRSDDRTFMVGSIIELIEIEKGVSIKTVTELVGKRNIKNMERARVDGIVANEDVSACLLSQEFLNPGVSHVISQILSNTIGSQIYFHPSRLVGRPIYDLQLSMLKHESNIQLIGIIQGKNQILNPPKNLIIGEGDKLVILAEDLLDLDRIEQEILVQA